MVLKKVSSHLTGTIVKKYAPELKVCIGDVGELPFKNRYFDGYWSLGLIEHYYYGFESMLKEMYRVLRPSGYLFLTFPSMNMLRSMKARLGKYEIVPKDYNPNTDNFFQFALNADDVIDFIESCGQVNYQTWAQWDKGF